MRNVKGQKQREDADTRNKQKKKRLTLPEYFLTSESFQYKHCSVISRDFIDLHRLVSVFSCQISLESSLEPLK